MKTKEQVIKENPQHIQIIEAVLSSINEDSIQDINDNGIDGGYGKFVYYNDTTAFTRKNRQKIISLLLEDAVNFGIGIEEMVNGFRCFENNDNEDKAMLRRFLFGGTIPKDETTILNGMAWYAAETVCRMFEDN